MLHPLTDEIIMNLKQLNNLLQRLTNYRFVYRSNKVTVGTGDEYTPLDNGNVLLGKAYTSSTDPCQDGNYLIGKYG